MKKFDTKKIVKILLLVSIILCLVAQIIPWGEFSIGKFGSVHFFHWGGLLVSAPLEDPPILELHFIINMGRDISGGAPGSLEKYGFSFGTLFLFFIPPLSLLSMIVGLVAYRNPSKKRSKNCLQACIMGIIASVSFILFIQLTILAWLEEFSPLFHWYYGFYIMIIASTLFLISFIILKRMPIMGEEIDTNKNKKIPGKS
jgi:hypothetical protein